MALAEVASFFYIWQAAVLTGIPKFAFPTLPPLGFNNISG